jgi:23S rRNA pseudouridine2605 synthase
MEEKGSETEATTERLQKVLAAAGIASRRECEELIVSGRVEVDRQTVVKLGTRVDPVNQEIRVDGVALPRPQRLYYVVHKPVGVVTTNYDPSGRARVIDLVPTDQRVFPVGRLDRTSEGLILVTNDGALANLLTHPRFGVEKTYWALVDGHPDNHTLDKLREGVHIAEGKAKASSVHVKRRNPGTSELIIVLDEGRNRQIRRMLARVGHKVLRLKRIAVGPLILGDLPAGACRKLGPQDVELLMEAIRAKRKQAAKARRLAKRAKVADAKDNSEAGDDADARSGLARPGNGQSDNSRQGSGRRKFGKRGQESEGDDEVVGIGAGDDEFEGEFDNEFDGDLKTDDEGDDVLIPDDASGRRKSSGAVLDWSDDDGDEATDDATDDATE